jgi:hypothetical protein
MLENSSYQNLITTVQVSDILVQAYIFLVNLNPHLPSPQVI